MQLESKHIMWPVVLALGAGVLAACGDNLPAPAQELGLATTFEVDDGGALVWIYAPESRWGRVRVERADGSAVADVGPVALERSLVGRVGAIEVAGLAPDTGYQYTIELESGSVTDRYRFRTAPAPDAAADVHFVWSADIDLRAEYDSPIFTTMSASGADFFVSLGDWPYADSPPAAQAADEYRVKHLAVRAAATVQVMLRALPVYAIYDDHEALNDWHGGHRVTEAERIADAIAVWDEWFPLRIIRQGQPHRWRSWRRGRHAELFMLDTRCCRSDNRDPDGPDKTMLGAEQKQWLIEALSASEATFKIVFTSVALIGNSDDDWLGFRYERDQILDELSARGVSGLVALTGDGHLFSSKVLPERGLREFMAGPLARGLAPLDPIDPAIIAQYQGFNYGEARISIGADGVPALEIVCRDPQGGVCYREVLRVEDLGLAAP